MKPWLLLMLAGLFEIGFTTFLKLSDNFSHWKYTLLFLVCAIVSFQCLSLAIKTIPLGTAYAIWTGIGAVGTVIIGILYFGESSNFIRVFLLLLIIFAIVGLKLSSSH